MTFISVQAYASKIRIMLSLLIFLMLAAFSILLPYGWIMALLIMPAMLLARPLLAYGHQKSRHMPQVGPMLSEWASAEPRLQERVLLQDGSERKGILVDISQQQPWKLVLTRDGYVLVDQNNEVRHSLSR